MPTEPEKLAGARDELWDVLGIDPERITRDEFDEYLNIYDHALATRQRNWDGRGPSTDGLRAAGMDAHIARLAAEADRQFSATWRGRVALRLARWYARRRR
ncbi:hypothetical protein [Streptomyces chartreusis]|uniref:hypothetical protein n=1 Tax=Streptomyces chartreusis TaxID=1969 RepID=UPI00381474BA